MPIHNSDDEMDQIDQFEQEYDLLNRQYTLMNESSKTAKNTLTSYVKKQEDFFLKQLTKEQHEVDTNLKLTASNAVKKKDFKNELEISNLRQAQLTFKEVVQNESQKSNHLDEIIENLEKQIEQHLQKSGNNSNGYANKLNSSSVRMKRIKVYENRLNTGTVKFNKLLTDNTNLREKIEHYRKERKVFNNLYRKLETKSEVLKFQIDDVIKRATSFYNSRDDHHSKMISLNERNDSDYNQFISEEKEISRIIAQQAKLTNFMSKKNSEKSEKAFQDALTRQWSKDDLNSHLEEQEMQKLEKVLNSIISILSDEKAQILLKILNKNSLSLTDNNSIEMSSIEQQQNINKEKVKELTEAIQPFCDRYKKTEEQNYSLFSYVNNLSHDIRILYEKINTNEKIQKSQIDASEIRVGNNKLQKAHLTADVMKTHQKISLLETSIRKNVDRFNNIKDSVDHLFNKLNCDHKTLDKKLDNQGKITIDNMDTYLSTIENNLNKLIEFQAKFMVENMTDDEEAILKSKGQNIKGQNGKTGKNQNDKEDHHQLPGSRQRKSRFAKEPTPNNNNSAPNPEDITNKHGFIDNLFGDLDSGILDLNSLKSRAEISQSERQKAYEENFNSNKARRKSMSLRRKSMGQK
jgi:chromosome segregation ATPase